MSDVKAEIDRLLDESIGKVTKAMWLRLPNPELNGLKPIDMMNTGQSERLLRIIKASLEENKRP